MQIRFLLHAEMANAEILYKYMLYIRSAIYTAFLELRSAFGIYILLQLIYRTF